MYILGIDPGYEGAISVLQLDDKGTIPLVTHPIPSIKLKKTKRALDIETLTALIDDLLANWPIKEAAIEEQIVKPGQGLASSALNMYNYGLIKGLVIGKGIKCFSYRSTKWQSIIPEDLYIPESIEQLPKELPKKRSICFASKLFPTYSLLKTKRCTVPSDGISDSLLIGYYHLSTIIDIEESPQKNDI